MRGVLVRGKGGHYERCVSGRGAEAIMRSMLSGRGVGTHSALLFSRQSNEVHTRVGLYPSHTY